MCVMEVQYPVGNGTTTIDLTVKVFLRYGLLRGCADRMETECLTIWYIMGGNVWFFFSFIVISWRLITLQYYSGFCHTLTWISHGFTCVPHPDPPSQRYGSIPSFKKSISQALSGEIRFKLNITRKGEKERLWDPGKQQAQDEQQTGDFPAGPVAKPLHSRCRGHSSDPRAGLTKVPHATRVAKKKKNEWQEVITRILPLR